MGRVLIYIALIAAVVWPAGCEPPQKTTHTPLEGIKLTDIQPPAINKPSSEINFRIFTFKMPAENISSLQNTFNELTDRPLRFTNKKAFNANGFTAGFGRNEIGNKIAEKLRQARAKRTKLSTLLVFNDKGDDIPIARAKAEQIIFYDSAEGETKKVTLSDGLLAWRITARPMPRLRGTAEIDILPVFKPRRQTAVAKLTERSKDKEIVFDSAAVKLRMSEGDFIFLAPRQFYPQRITLSDLFFTSRGNFFFPRTNAKQDNENNSDPPAAKWHKDIPLLHIYMIVCTRVQD